MTDIRKAGGALLLMAVLATPTASVAQTSSVSISGLAYMDYTYTLQGADGTVGDNGFGYRRLYLTSAAKLSDKMRFQARLEANDGATNEAGLPMPFVKDLFLRWDDALAAGHRITIGVSSPPSFTVSEKFFGYRSLEKTILDKNKIVSSRDMGIAFSGPLMSDGALRYGLMLANNNSVRAEGDRHKRVYGQLEWYPSDNLTMTLGSDFASLEGGSSITTNGFIGYRLPRVRFGLEGYFSPITMDDEMSDMDRSGLTVFGALALTDALEAIARYDAYSTDANGNSASGAFGLIGFSWTVQDNVHIIPNIEIEDKPGSDDAQVLGRMTLHVDF